jgi:hypothetical protein
VVGNETIDLVQLKKRYYEPGLLAKVMGYNKEPLGELREFDRVELYPDVKLTPPSAGDPRLKIRLRNRGGGIGPVVVLVDGKEVEADARGPGADPEAKEVNLEVNLSGNPLVAPGQSNRIEVRAFTADGYLKSRALEEEYEAPGEPLRDPPEFWGIVAGVSDYDGEAIDLGYAAKDAEDVARALELAATKLFGRERVHLTLLTTAGTKGARAPTRDNLVGALKAARKAKPNDLLVVYLSGHGVTGKGQEGDYYYLTKEARGAELDDPAVREHTSVSSEELAGLMKLVLARKQVLVLDTCGSGRVVQRLTEQRAVPASQIRAIDRMEDRTGLYVLSGSTADASSYEASRYAQGLLTYSVLLGMKGAALRDDEYVDVSKLFQYVKDQVPRLAEENHHIQKPQIASPGGSFDIGRVTEQEKELIQVATAKPFVLRAVFQEEKVPVDRLELAKRVNQHLRDVSFRGSNPPHVYVDASELPGAYLLSGRYQVTGEEVGVEVYLFEDREEKGHFAVRGGKGRLDDLASKIVTRVDEELAAQGRETLH